MFNLLAPEGNSHGKVCCFVCNQGPYEPELDASGPSSTRINPWMFPPHEKPLIPFLVGVSLTWQYATVNGEEEAAVLSAVGLIQDLIRTIPRCHPVPDVGGSAQPLLEGLASAS